MVGSGVLTECLEDPRVRSVLVVGRNLGGVAHPKLRELISFRLLRLQRRQGRPDGLQCLLSSAWACWLLG